MTTNLQIELLKQQLNAAISNSELPMGVIEIILQQFSKEYSSLYAQQLEKEYQEYQEHLRQEEEEKGEK